MLESSNNTEAAERTKATLVAKIDRRVVPALDKIAGTNQMNTAQLMSRLFSDIAETLEVIITAKDNSYNSVKEWFAALIVERCPQATPEALRAMGRIWDRAAEIKAQKGGIEG